MEGIVRNITRKRCSDAIIQSPRSCRFDQGRPALVSGRQHLHPVFQALERCSDKGGGDGASGPGENIFERVRCGVSFVAENGAGVVGSMEDESIGQGGEQREGDPGVGIVCGVDGL